MKYRKDSIFDEMMRMQEEMDRLFKDYFLFSHRPLFNKRHALPGHLCSLPVTLQGLRTPVTDIQETEDSIVATLEIPGARKGDISLNLSSDSLEVKAEKKHEKKYEDRKLGTFRRESSFSGFYRKIPLPAEINPDKADASYKNGVLEVRMPKSEKQKATGKKIEIK